VRPILLAALAAALVAVPSARSAVSVSIADGTLYAVDHGANQNRVSFSYSEDEDVVWLYDDGHAMAAQAPCAPTSPTIVECPADLVDEARFELGPQNDAFDLRDTPIPLVVDGGAGNDTLHGGAAADVLVGGEGDDLLVSEEDMAAAADAALDCGPGDDRIDADNDLDAEPVSCEIVAPEFAQEPRLLGDSFHIGGTVAVGDIVLTGTDPDEIIVRWEKCFPTFCSSFGPGEPEWTFTAADYNRRYRASVTVSNAAGADRGETELTPAITRAPATLIGPPTITQPTVLHVPRPPATIPQQPPPPRVLSGRDLVGQLRKAFGPLAQSLAARLAGRDPRRLRGRIRHGPMLMRYTGDLRVSWTVPASVARRHGVRVAKRGAPVTLARGVVNGSEGAQVVPVVELTAAGRRALSRARSLAVTLTLHAGGPLPSTVVEGSARFTLKRKRRP
jgi:hypothetical protein